MRGRVPQTGHPAPELVLSTAHDVEVSLTESVLRGPVLVEFVRGTWDPNARERIALLNAAKKELDERSARVLFVTCERVDTVTSYLETHNGPWSFLVDRTRKTTRSWGVFQRFSFGAFNVAKASSFLIDRCGFVRFVHVGRSPIDVAPLDEIRAVLDSLEHERPVL